MASSLNATRQTIPEVGAVYAWRRGRGTLVEVVRIEDRVVIYRPAPETDSRTWWAEKTIERFNTDYCRTACAPVSKE